MNKISLKALKRIQGMSRNKILAVLPNIEHGGAFLPANFVKDGGATCQPILRAFGFLPST